MRGGLLILILAFLLAACSIEKFEEPDIKDDYCNTINFYLCKCAFHNDHCKNVGMDKGEANAVVQAGYQEYVQEKLEEFLLACETSGGIPDKDRCIRCDDGYVREGDECVESKTDIQNDLTECVVEDFDKNWRKYSDIDEVIPFEERSYEAKQAAQTADEIVEKTIKAFELEYDLELERIALEEARTYKQALVLDLKTNLLKSAIWGHSIDTPT